MKCIAVINVFHSDRQYVCTISTRSQQVRFKPVNDNNKFVCDSQIVKETKLIQFTVQTWSFWFFLNELNVSAYYRQCVIRHVNQLEGLIPVIVIVEPHLEVIDREWNEMTRHTAWEKVELDHLLSWLSTLGGAFSALGDSKSNCAKIAGKISFYQLKLGLLFGDPLIVVRSKLFVSLSLIQRGRLRFAKKIIRQQYEVAKQEEEYDPRLKKMCVGIWMKLQYAYHQRSYQKQMSIRKEVFNKPKPSDYLNVLLYKNIENNGRRQDYSLITTFVNHKCNQTQNEHKHKIEDFKKSKLITRYL